jgi:hypothetical protein
VHDYIYINMLHIDKDEVGITINHIAKTRVRQGQVAWEDNMRGLGKKTSHSSYSSPPKYPTVPPDVWIPSTKHHRLQSSGNFRKLSK